MFVMDEMVGICLFEMYCFMIFICFVGVYYSELVCVKLEEYYICVSVGGVGCVKIVGNYGVLFFLVKKG